jgi:hypothetical protein
MLLGLPDPHPFGPPGSTSGSVRQRYGSEDPHPDPYQNVTDPQHWLKQTDLFLIYVNLYGENSENTGPQLGQIYTEKAGTRYTIEASLRIPIRILFLAEKVQKP